MSVVWSDVLIAQSLAAALCAGVLLLLAALQHPVGARRPVQASSVLPELQAIPISERFLATVDLDRPGYRIASPPGMYRRRTFQPVEGLLPEISLLYQRCETGPGRIMEMIPRAPVARLDSQAI